jgi:succinyl-diaminopimelate desuccinylase
VSDPDLLARTVELVEIPSVSHNEAAIGDHIAAVLAAAPWLELTRIGTNVVARTALGRPSRLILAGHTDTVPVNGNDKAVVDGTTIYGLGSADMKSGLAAMIELALATPEPAVDLTFVFYACEEVSQRYSGLGEIESERPDLLAGDAAILGEPTGARVEAGCQGVLKVDVLLQGRRAHTARPWTGQNAIHRLAPLLTLVDQYRERRPVIDGCEFREALQAVAVSGGVATNVVPDEARVTVNHRFAPDRTVEEAFVELAEHLGGALDEAAGDEITLEDSSRPAPPGLEHPLLAALVERSSSPPAAKLGWTDVSFFAARGIPAANFGPGEPTVAHTADECVELSQIVTAFETLSELIGEPAG